MKQSFLALLVCLISISFSFGQANDKGNININVGLGLSPTYFSDLQEIESTPIHFSADYSIFSFLSAGLGWTLASGSQLSNVDNIQATLVSSYNTFSLRGNAHVSPFERIDIYLGGSVGIQRVVDAYRQLNTPLPSTPEEVKSSVFQPEAHVGVRFRFLGNIGLYAEGGYGLSLVQAGLNMKL